jgi:hypothetical protein
MALPPAENDGPPAVAGLFGLLPGPDRKRSAAHYRYRLGYRNPDPDAPGCVMVWEVAGGRLAYQIAIERDEAGNLHAHCTCADAIFRAEPEGRCCKHVRGFLEAAEQLSHAPKDGASYLRRGA